MFDKDILIPISIFAAVIAGFVYFLIRNAIDERKRREEIYAEWEREPELPELSTVVARVILKRTDINYYNKSLKNPQHNIAFFLTFLTDDNKTVEYSVSQELFESVRESDIGTLVTQNGEFFDFGEGEEIN